MPSKLGPLNYEFVQICQRATQLNKCAEKFKYLPNIAGSFEGYDVQNS